MSIAVDSQHFGNEHPQMRFYSATPQFTDPWQAASPTAGPAPPAASYPVHGNAHTAANNDSARHVRQTSQNQMAFHQPVGASMSNMAMPSGTYTTGGLAPSQPAQVDSPLQGYMARYSSDFGSAAPMNVYGTQPGMIKPEPEAFAAGQPQIRSNSFAAFADRRMSHPSVASSTSNNLVPIPSAQATLQNSSSLEFLSRLQVATEAERNSFSDALDASRGMVAMSQDITPRNIYDCQRQRQGTEAYGFPATHSTHSSFSSSTGYPGYYGGGSLSEASYGGYSSATESVASARSSYSQNSYMGGQMPAAASMMGQFSSKVNSSSQKKHKCKICDKRFTRPSSLQTHMYSHTGEKPFACDVDGCGRQFSVVSNLRRHRKVHRGEGEALSDTEE